MKRRGIGLALSGGGYRAALFHLGSLRRLFEIGVLQDSEFRTISSVSGGSLVAAAVAQGIVTNGGAWPADLDTWKRLVEAPMRALTRADLRTGVLARKYLLPWRFFNRDYAVEAFAARLRERLTSLRLRELPASPAFAICCTDLAFGANFVFSRDRMGSWLAGTMTPPDDFPLALAAATNAAFPPLFGPLRLRSLASELKGGKASEAERRAGHADLRLSDGGVYDNLGVEPIWKSHAVVLVSDGSGIFQGETDRGLFWRIARYQGVQEEQARRLRRRSLRIGFKKGTLRGATWSVGGVRGPGYSRGFAREVLANVRTDLDAFTDVEAGVLMNHGYLSTASAMASLVPEVGRGDVSLSAPFPELVPPQVEEASLRIALRESRMRKTFGRG
jgi:NTE family protein